MGGRFECRRRRRRLTIQGPADVPLRPKPRGRNCRRGRSRSSQRTSPHSPDSEPKRERQPAAWAALRSGRKAGKSPHAHRPKRRFRLTDHSLPARSDASAWRLVQQRSPPRRVAALAALRSSRRHSGDGRFGVARARLSRSWLAVRAPCLWREREGRRGFRVPVSLSWLRGSRESVEIRRKGKLPAGRSVL